MDKEIISELVGISDLLDKKGLVELSDKLDSIISKLNNLNLSSDQLSKSPKEITVESPEDELETLVEIYNSLGKSLGIQSDKD